ncbi:MAG TPA: ATP-binding protein [Steroidobacteraceae bacterium]|nr:ATP-binding protein [Steroidobacteraceae bacterium]
MTTIHDDDPGSRVRELERSRPGAGLERDAVMRRNDELETVLAAGRLGYCRIEGMDRALTANAQFAAEFGWAPDETVTWEGLQGRIHGSDRKKFLAAVDAAFSVGTEVDLIIRTQLPGRERQWVTLRGRTVHSESGEPTDLVLTSRNVSSARRAAAGRLRQQVSQLEQERKLREVAEAANRAKDEFLSVISHELRSPLNAILGWNRILSLKRADDSEVAAIAPRIEQSAKAQLKMVNDLLDLGRLGTGKLNVERRPIRLAHIVSLAVDLARPAAAAKAIELETHLAPGSGPPRLGDPDRLQQVVSNLLSNAVKFTPSGGRIEVSLADVEGLTQLTVADTGQGIAPELLPHIFDRFRQGDSSSTRHSGGLGLGLTLVREIVSLHGGTVTASSPGVGAGATFIVRLPAAPAPTGQWAGNGIEHISSRRSLDGLSILVVDDEMDARTVVAETLRLEGARVTVTDSAGSAFQQLQAAGAHFDILVTDIGMPDEDGYSLVKKLRMLQGGRHILAIAVTGYASKGDVAAAIEAGFDLHVPKPVDFDTFVPMVRRLAALTRQ